MHFYYYYLFFNQRRLFSLKYTIFPLNNLCCNISQMFSDFSITHSLYQIILQKNYSLITVQTLLYTVYTVLPLLKASKIPLKWHYHCIVLHLQVLKLQTIMNSINKQVIFSPLPKKIKNAWFLPM